VQTSSPPKLAGGMRAKEMANANKKAAGEG
jgi:hypothetical protein